MQPLRAAEANATQNQAAGESWEAKPEDACFARFHPRKAPAPSGLLLKAGDRVAICGDSITEQQGINLAADFVSSPFSEAYAKVDAAVAAKQAYETRQIKDLFDGPEGRFDMAATVTLTEKARAPLVAAIRKTFTPVTHTLKIERQ